MDKSYKSKLENWLATNIVNEQLLFSCLAAFDAKASRLASRREQYKHTIRQVDFAEADTQLQKLISYRAPFIAVLRNDYHLSLDEIKAKITATLSDPRLRKNIPTKQQIDRVREVILSGFYYVVS